MNRQLLRNGSFFSIVMYVLHGKRQKSCTLIVIWVIVSYLTSPIFNSSSKSTGFFLQRRKYIIFTGFNGGMSLHGYQPLLWLNLYKKLIDVFSRLKLISNFRKKRENSFRARETAFDNGLYSFSPTAFYTLHTFMKNKIVQIFCNGPNVSFLLLFDKKKVLTTPYRNFSLLVLKMISFHDSMSKISALIF